MSACRLRLDHFKIGPNAFCGRLAAPGFVCLCCNCCAHGRIATLVAQPLHARHQSISHDVTNSTLPRLERAALRCQMISYIATHLGEVSWEASCWLARMQAARLVSIALLQSPGASQSVLPPCACTAQRTKCLQTLRAQRLALRVQVHRQQ